MRLCLLLALALAFLPSALGQGTRIKDLPLVTSIGTNARVAVDDTIGMRGATTYLLGQALGPYVNPTNQSGVTITNGFLSGRFQLYGDGLEIDGNETNDISGNIRSVLFDDLSSFELANIDSSYIDANNSTTIRSGGDLTLWGVSNVYFLTPAALTFSAPSNAVLTIKDPLTGKVDFTPIEQLVASTLTAGKATYLDSSKKLASSSATSTELGFLSGVSYSLATSARLKELTAGELYQITSCSVDSDGCITSGTVLWPDGSGGTFTRTSKDATWLVVNGYTITHTDSGKTVTQSTVTRDSSTGAVTTKPALTVSP